MNDESQFSYPATPRDDSVDVLHGQRVLDPYRWLEDASRPAVREWMDAQDRLARSALAALPGRDQLAQRLKELFYTDSVSPPVKRGGRYFYARKHADREKTVHYWRASADAPERVLLDPNTMSEDGSISVGVVIASWDGRLVAYTLKQRGADAATLHVLDVDSGVTSEVDRIEGARYAQPAWTPDGAGFYYAGLPVDPSIPVDQLPGYVEIRFHRVGTPASADALVHPRTGDPTRFLGVQLSRDGRWLLVYDQHGWTSTDIYIKDLLAPSGEFRPVVKGTDARYAITVWQDVLYVSTDEGAPRGRVFRAEAAAPAREAWRELVPESPDATLESASVVGGKLALVYLRNASNAIQIHDLDGREVRGVELPGLGSTSGLIGNPDDDEAYFTFGSYTFPPEVYRTSVATGATDVWARIEIPVDPEPLTVEQVWFTSRDGTKVSMFLVHRKDLRRDGNNPVLLGGYGGFNQNTTPTFQPALYPWFERGGVYAAPNLRGGGEYGEAWHRAGMLDRKQNTFDDYIAAAEWLIENRYTRPERLAIRGGSNGGLLVGAALVQRPELFRAVICAVPLLDMVRYHRFGSGRTWISEYGSADDPRQFAFLHAYSPYHHVRKGVRYPALLMMTADNDDRVDPMHARKMTAELQWAQAAPHPILMRVERNAGHTGADLRRKDVESFTDQYSFLFWQLGMAL
ncbi:MAG: S9 family peptidase [Acidobacteria bacterium]|nr:S9 family peptidase [Acidobacteriota bacterium]